MRNILLDTNAYAAFKQGQPEAVEILQRAPSIGINSIVLGELLGGFAAGQRVEENRHELRLFLASPRVVVLQISENTAEHYATVYLNLRRKGKPIPTNDMWIAASALQHRFVIFTYDRHYTHIDGLTAGSSLEELIQESK
jgi:predicted nucleic acid-binding protein